jgi:hypothetical protein
VAVHDCAHETAQTRKPERCGEGRRPRRLDDSAHGAASRRPALEKRFSGLVDDAVLTVRGRERLVRVINISGEGAMITAATPTLRIGERVALRLAGDIQVEGAVRWIRDGADGDQLLDSADHRD